MFRISSLVLLLCSATAPAFALEGRVVDKATGNPIAGAEVSILGRPGTAMTDADGRFVWQPDPTPPFEVLVVLRGERYTNPVLVESLPDSCPLELPI